MADQHEAWADAMLRRPVVDPGIPDADRALLTAHSALLTPAGWDRPARRRLYLPIDPAKRLETVDGAVMGMTSAMITAVFGTVPLAVGTLLLQNPSSWEYTSNRYALLLAEIIAIVTAVVLGVRIARFGQPTGKIPAVLAARTYHGRYLTGADFDARSRVLLRRAQDAIDSVLSSQVCAADLLDQAAARAALASQEWEIASVLREQARLRVRRSELPSAPGRRRPRCSQFRRRQRTWPTPASQAGWRRWSVTRPRSRRPTPPGATGSRPRSLLNSRASTWTWPPAPRLTNTESRTSRP